MKPLKKWNLPNLVLNRMMIELLSNKRTKVQFHLKRSSTLRLSSKRLPEENYEIRLRMMGTCHSDHNLKRIKIKCWSMIIQSHTGLELPSTITDQLLFNLSKSTQLLDKECTNLMPFCNKLWMETKNLDQAAIPKKGKVDHLPKKVETHRYFRKKAWLNFTNIKLHRVVKNLLDLTNLSQKSS